MSSLGKDAQGADLLDYRKKKEALGTSFTQHTDALKTSEVRLFLYIIFY
jgi:hypothetical protein